MPYALWGVDGSSTVGKPTLLGLERAASFIRLAIELGAEPNLNRGVQQSNALLVAAHRENPHAVKVLLDGGADSNARALDGKNAGSWLLSNWRSTARKPQRIDCLRHLIEAGFDLNARIEGDQTLLTSAYAWSHFDAVEALLDFGADPHAKHGGQHSLAENFELSGPGFIEGEKHAPLTYRLRSILERTKLDAGAALAQGAKRSTIRV